MQGESGGWREENEKWKMEGDEREEKEERRWTNDRI